MQYQPRVNFEDAVRAGVCRDGLIVFIRTKLGGAVDMDTSDVLAVCDELEEELLLGAMNGDGSGDGGELGVYGNPNQRSGWGDYGDHGNGGAAGYGRSRSLYGSETKGGGGNGHQGHGDARGDGSGHSLKGSYGEQYD